MWGAIKRQGRMFRLLAEITGVLFCIPLALFYPPLVIHLRGRAMDIDAESELLLAEHRRWKAGRG